MTDSKTIGIGIVMVVVTFLATYFMTAGTRVVEAGLDAQVKEQIRTVLREEMVVDINGVTMTYSQVLSLLHTQSTANAAALDVLLED